MKPLAQWPRCLSEAEMNIVSSHDWERLCDKQPQDGQPCRHILIHPNWPSGDRIDSGEWVVDCPMMIGEVTEPEAYPLMAGATGFRSNDGGIFVSDPQYTYWQPLDS